MMQLASLPPRDRRRRAPLDGESEALLAAFRRTRELERASPRSAAREVSQVRSVLREIGGGTPAPPVTLLDEPDRLVSALREPRGPVSLSTVRARYIASQRFIRFLARAAGRDPEAVLSRVAAGLPKRATASWHTDATVLAGTRGRRRHRGPTLSGADLHSIVEAVDRPGLTGARDRALVALHCFSGARPGEIVGLTWEQLGEGLQAYRHDGLTAKVRRAEREVHLILVPEAAAPLKRLRDLWIAAGLRPGGAVFRRSLRNTHALTPRAANDSLRKAIAAAGLPPVTAAGLRAAFAHWLRTIGLSDHEVRGVLGLVRVRSVDQLLRPHAALDAQRIVKEIVW